MIKIQNNTPTRAPIPDFLQGLAPESLADLSWTDPALGVQDCKWWPEVDQSPALNQFERYGDETLTLGDGVVIVTRAVVPWTAEEIAAESAEKVKQVIAAIKAERDRRIQRGGYKVGTKWFHSDTFSRTQQMGLVMMGSNMPTGLLWKSLDGTFVAMTPTLAGQIFAAAAANDAAIFTTAETHIAAVKASATPWSYDYSTGWPPEFAG